MESHFTGYKLVKSKPDLKVYYKVDESNPKIQCAWVELDMKGVTPKECIVLFEGDNPLY